MRPVEVVKWLYDLQEVVKWLHAEHYLLGRIKYVKYLCKDILYTSGPGTGAPGDTAPPVLVRPYGVLWEWGRSVGVYQGSRRDPAR